MFCDEKIIAAYYGSREYDDIEGTNSFFDCYHELAYHVTPGERIILETKHWYIFLTADGIAKQEKKVPVIELENPGEVIEPFLHDDAGEVPWVDYESTLFVGERLLRIEKVQNYYNLIFDDFELKVISHELNEDEFPSLYNEKHTSYNHVLGLNHLLKRKCDCGGTGKVLLDFTSDYLVHCENCKKSTWAQMNVIDAIEEWNAGKLECVLPDIEIE